MHLHDDSPVVARPATLAVFAIAYYLATLLGEHAFGTLAVPSPFWVPDSVLLCALILAPRSQWWIFVLAIVPIRLLSGVVPGTPLWFQVLTIGIDAAKGIAAAWLLQYVLHRPVRLRSLQEFIAFVGIAAIAVPALSILVAAPARVALGNPIWKSAYEWFMGDLLAQVLVTPTLLFWCTGRYARGARAWELLLVCAGLVVVLVLGFFRQG